MKPATRHGARSVTAQQRDYVVQQVLGWPFGTKRDKLRVACAALGLTAAETKEVRRHLDTLTKQPLPDTPAPF